MLSPTWTQVLKSILQDVLEVRIKWVSQSQEEVDEQLLGQARRKNGLDPQSRLHLDMRSWLDRNGE